MAKKKENEVVLINYRNLTGDDTKFYVNKERKLNRISKKLKKGFLKKHSY